jgi:hypothetical protein
MRQLHEAKWLASSLDASAARPKISSEKSLENQRSGALISRNTCVR